MANLDMPHRLSNKFLTDIYIYAYMICRKRASANTVILDMVVNTGNCSQK